MPTRPGTPQSVLSKTGSVRLQPNTLSSASRRTLVTPMSRRMLTPGRTEKGALITEPSDGQDTLYDGAYEMKSIAMVAAPKGSNPYAQRRAYSTAFISKVPGHEAPFMMSREQKLTPILGESGGPQYYNPYGNHSLSDASHTLSGSIYWMSRGRLGPIGCGDGAFMKRSASFASQVPRTHFTAKEPQRRRGINANDEAAQSFLLRRDVRQQNLLRSDFHSNLQQAWSLAPLSSLSRPSTSPYY